MKIKRGIAVTCSIIGTLLLILVILLCLPVTVPRLMGYQIFTVVSGSMEPEIPVGSLVYVSSCAPEKLEENEIIAFYSSVDTGAIITHRVVKNRTVSGELVTKGDANEENDMLPVSYGNVIGKVEKSIPKLGLMTETLTTTQGKIASISLIALSFFLHGLSMLLSRKKKKS